MKWILKYTLCLCWLGGGGGGFSSGGFSSGGSAIVQKHIYGW